MITFQNRFQQTQGLTLILGGTDKTGRRIAKYLQTRGIPTHIGKRSVTSSRDVEATNLCEVFV